MHKSGVLILYFILTMRNVLVAGSSITTNIYAKTHRIYEEYSLHGTGYTPLEHFLGVRGGGVAMELEGDHLARFTNLVQIVSNCQSMA